MKIEGSVVSWNDVKGFGFVESLNSPRAFVHIKSFPRQSKRPVNGDKILYDLTQASDSRYQAINIEFSNSQTNTTSHYHQYSKTQVRGKKAASPFSIIFVAMFAMLLMTLIAIDKTPDFIFWWYLLSGIITFIAYAIDKSAAIDGRWRTKESSLHLLALVGGWVGGYFAQLLLRHKSSKTSFKRVYWCTVLGNLGAFYWVHTPKGSLFVAENIQPTITRFMALITS